MDVRKVLVAYRKKFNEPIAIPYMLPTNKNIKEFVEAVENCIVIGEKFDYEKFGLKKIDKNTVIQAGCGMDKKKFLKKAKEMGYTQELIDEIVKDVEKNIALGLPMDWEMCLLELPISD